MLKKIIVFFACILMCGFCLFGCGKTDENENLLQEKENSSENDRKAEENEDNALGNGEEPEGDNQTKTTSFPGPEENAIPVTLLENYKEKDILSDPRILENKEQYSNILLNERNEIEFYTVDETEQNIPVIWKYTLSGDSWDREEVSWLEGVKGEIDQRRITVFAGADRNYYAWYVDHKEMSHLVKQTGDSFEEIPIPDWDKTQERNYYMVPGQVAVLEDGSIVMAHQGKECYIYDKEDGAIKTSFRCGWYKSLCVSKNEIFILDWDNRSILHYDAEQGEFLPEIQGNFDATAMFFVQENQIYGCYPGGIYQADCNGTQFQKIMDAGVYHFSKENGTLLKLFVVEDVFYIAYGEGCATIMKYAPEEEGTENRDFLTVYSLEANPLVIDMIAAFRQEYPEIEIIYETGEGAEGSTTAADRIRVLNARILAGDGPDIIVLDGLPADSYVDKGVLLELTPVLQAEKENLLSNVLDAYTKEGEIYMLPMRIMVPVIVTSGQEKEKYSSLDALADYSEENGGGVIGSRFSCAYFLEMLYYNFSPDLVSENGEVNREAIREFLEQVKRLCESEQASMAEKTKRDDYLGGIGDIFRFSSGEIELIFTNVQGIYELGEAPALAERRGGELLGNQNFFIPNGVVGINRASKNQELAKLFVETVFSYKLQDMAAAEFNGFPIQEEVLEEQAQFDLSYLVSTYVLEDGSGFECRNFSQQEAGEMVQIVRQVRTPRSVDMVIYEIIEDEAMPYLNGKKGLDESADGIASRIQLYLYE